MSTDVNETLSQSFPSSSSGKQITNFATWMEYLHFSHLITFTGEGLRNDCLNNLQSVGLAFYVVVHFISPKCPFCAGKQPTKLPNLRKPLQPTCGDFSSSECTHAFCRFRHICTIYQGNYPAYQCRGPLEMNQLESRGTVTPLRPLILEHELVDYPDKGFICQLPCNLRKGCAIGYFGPQFILTASHLPSAFQQPAVIDSTLEKEIAANQIIGPF